MDNTNYPVTPANKAYNSLNPITTIQSWIEFKDIDMKGGPADEMKPSTWQPFFSSLTGESNGIGKYWPGTDTNGGNGRRGGNWGYSTSAGIYSLRLSGTGGYYGAEMSFRCVYRP